MTVETSASYVLSIGSSSADDKYLGLSSSLSMMDVSVGISYEHHWSKEQSKGAEQEKEHGESATTSFTLFDEQMGDMIDVQVGRDPVFGTPVFRTVGGRTVCPHEHGTDARERISMSFPKQPEIYTKGDVPWHSAKQSWLLDMSYHTNGKALRNVVAKGKLNADGVYGTAKPECARFYIDVQNQAVYGDAMSFGIGLDWSGVTGGKDTPVADGGLGDWAGDFSGMFITVDGYAYEPTGMQLEFVEKDQGFVGGGERHVIEICPMDGRIFDARKSADFCNLKVTTYSMCEDEFGNANGDGLSKMFFYNAKEDTDVVGCDDGQAPLPAIDPAAYNGACSTLVNNDVFGETLLMAQEGIIGDSLTINCISWADPEGKSKPCALCPNVEV